MKHRTPEERTAAMELAAVVGVKEAARQLGIPYRTLQEWRSPRMPSYHRAFDRQLGAAITAVMTDLAQPGADRKPLLDALDRLVALRRG